MRRPAAVAVGAVAALVLVGAVAALPAVRFFWSWRASNPVRHGLAVAGRAGCFSCHGPLGSQGVPDPVLGREVPPWSGGVWMMYVKDEGEIREFILDGVSRRRAASETAAADRARAAIRMPAYRGRLSSAQVDDVVAAFLVVSGMKRPADDTPEGRGFDVATERRCLACHAPGGAGGLPNPGSFTGFIPGWYGADFGDLVRDRGEFDAWVHRGAIPRLTGNAVARRFMRHQAVRMPSYRDLPPADLDALWAYVSWLGRTRGGLDAPSRSF